MTQKQDNHARILRSKKSSDMSSIYLRARFFIIAAAALLTACESVPEGSPTWVRENAKLDEYRMVKVEDVLNESGNDAAEKVTVKLTGYLKAGLGEKGFVIANDDESESKVLVVRTRLIAFEAGSALARWAAPGAGKTQCTLQTTLLDSQTNQKLADFISDPVVAGGGLFSIGAEHWIQKSCAGDIVEQVDRLVSK